MIPIDQKTETLRQAQARSCLKMKEETLKRIQEGRVPKPGVLETARAAGLLAAKKTPELIPHCHPLSLEAVDLSFQFEKSQIIITSSVTTISKTGVEMEALVSANVAALTIYDMVKALDKTMEITSTRLLEKKGGKSQFQERFPSSFKKALLITDSSIYKGKKEDRITPLVQKALASYGMDLDFQKIVTNDINEIKDCLLDLCEKRFSLVLTAGGSGLDAGDVTVEAVQEIMERPLPGVMEAARQYGQRRSPYALLSRGVAGQRGNTLLIPLPGSSKGVEESLAAILPGVLHGLNVALRKNR